jgi:hypothetical protein
MNILEKIDEYLNENDAEDKKKANDLIDGYIKRVGKNFKKVRKEILDNVVNTKFGKSSNKFVEVI